MEVASERLIAAAAALDPGDRALLSLMLNHGLDDHKIARVSNSSVDAVVARRELMTERLSAILGLPPAEVGRVLRELSGTGGSHAHSTGDGRTVIRWVPWGAALIVALAIAGVVVLIVVLSGGGPTPAHKAATPTARAALVSLPGGPKGVTGSLRISGAPRDARLSLRVEGLPPSGGGHYEVWLYNSVIDSRPLGALAAPAGDLSVALPADYRRFRWLDVSMQRGGAVSHSGVSIVRARLP